MISRYTPPFRTTIPPQWRGACAAVAGGGPNRATAIVVARLVFTIGLSRAFTALRLIDIVTAMHRSGERVQITADQCPRISAEYLAAEHREAPGQPSPAGPALCGCRGAFCRLSWKD
jgi:hypothetical protein